MTKNNMAKQVYYIKYGKEISLIKSPLKTTRFSFVDSEEDETIVELVVNNNEMVISGLESIWNSES